VVVRIDDLADEQRWPRFVDRARDRGVGSSLSVPLEIADDGTWGGFNVYGAAPHGFDADDEQLCRTFAAQASIVVSNLHAYWKVLNLARNLNEALISRAGIEQAKGILMATQRISADEAFDRLRQRSQTENRKLRDIAADVVAGVLDRERD
jgi:GAF domain-containing protein